MLLSASTATVAVGTTIQAVPGNLLGVNAAPWDFNVTTSSTLTLSEAAGIDSVRLGGGSYVDGTWHFNVQNNSSYQQLGQQAEYVANMGASAIVDVNYGSGSPEEAVAEWAYLNGNPSDTTSIAGLFGNNAGDAEQWNGSSWTQGVNWGTIGSWATLRANTGSNYLNLGHAAFNFTNWEIGNELYGSWETDKHGTGGDALPMPSGDTLAAHDPTTMISFAKQFQSAINSVLSDGFESAASPISIGYDSQDPLNAGTNGFGNNTDGNWIADTLHQASLQGFTVGFVADHWYTNQTQSVSSGDASDSGLLAVSNSAAGASVSGLSSYTNTSNPYNWQTRAFDYDTDFHANDPGAVIKLIADEVNSISGNPGEQSTSLVNGLFMADALGAVLNTTGTGLYGLGGYEGFDVWALHNGPVTGYTASTLYHWRTKGDYGILGDGSAGAPTDGLNEPYPDYFAIQLASKIILPSGGTVVSASEDSSADELKVDTYAVLEANGDLELLVINKTSPGTQPPSNLPDPTLTWNFDLTGYTASNSATIWQYGVAQDDAQDNATNDSTSLMTSPISLSISNGDFSYALPDYSMSVFILTPSLVVTQAAAANPSSVTGTTTTLSALGSEGASGSGLNYTWSATSVPAGVTAPTYSVNGTNAASTTVATFFGAGSYSFLVTITDASNNSVTSSVNVTVYQTYTSIVVNPPTATIYEDATQQFSATADDQFNVALGTQPSFTWSLTSGIGGVNSSGLYTAPAAAGSATVQAAHGSVQGSASVTINYAPPTVAQAAAANANPVTTTSTALSVLGADDNGESVLTYSWAATGPSGVTYSGNTNGTNAAKAITANFTQAGSYNFTVTITDTESDLFTTSSVAVNVQQTPTGVIVMPSSVTIATGSNQQFSATATDQFGNAISSPTFNWSITGTSSGNSINSSGLAMLGSTPGTYTVKAALGSASNTASVTTAVAPTVSAFQVNDGNAQRSMVDSLTVTFNEPVTLSAGAITLNQLSQTGGSPTPMTFTLTPSSGSSATWVLTFTDPSYVGGSLPDGAYELIVSAGGVTGNAGLNMSADQDFTLYRLYGDFYGTGSVTGSDFTLLTTLLGGATGSTYWYVDFNDSGFVTGGDYTQFTIRLGTTANIPALPSVEVLSAAPATTSTPAATTTTLTTKKPSVTKFVSSVAAAPKPVSKPKPKHGHG